MSFLNKLLPPALKPTIPPSTVPGERRITWESLLGKPTSLKAAGITDVSTGTTPAPIVGPLELKAKGAPPLKLERTETAAATRTLIEIRRNAVTRAFVGLDNTDNVVILAADGTTILFTVIGSGLSTGEVGALLRLTAPHIEAVTDAKAPSYLDGGGLQVVGAQLGAIAAGVATSGSAGGSDSAGGSPSDPATLGDVDGVYAVTNAHHGLIADALATATTALTKANAALAAMGTHGLIHP